MAITYPRAFPLDGCFTEECSFGLAYQQTRAITGGGSVNVADVGPPMWRGDYVTEALTRQQFGEWEAWLASLRGGLRMFRGRPPLWRWPMAHPRGFTGILYSGSQWDTTGNLATISTERDVITVNEMPNGVTLGLGDYLMVPAGSRRSLHRVIEGATSASSAITLTVEPGIRPGVATGVQVFFHEPWCEMVLFGEPRTSRKGTRGGSIAFTGMQVLI